MSVVRNAHRQELYNREMREGWRGSGEKQRKERERGGGEEGDIFPLQACSCPDQLQYFSYSSRGETADYAIKGEIGGGKLVFSST